MQSLSLHPCSCRQLPLSAALHPADEATTKNISSSGGGGSGLQCHSGAPAASPGGWDCLVAAALAALPSLQALLVEQGMELGPSCFGCVY